MFVPVVHWRGSLPISGSWCIHGGNEHGLWCRCQRQPFIPLHYFPAAPVTIIKRRIAIIQAAIGMGWTARPNLLGGDHGDSHQRW